MKGKIRTDLADTIAELEHQVGNRQEKGVVRDDAPTMVEHAATDSAISLGLLCVKVTIDRPRNQWRVSVFGGSWDYVSFGCKDNPSARVGKSTHDLRNDLGSGSEQ